MVEVWPSELELSIFVMICMCLLNLTSHIFSLDWVEICLEHPRDPEEIFHQTLIFKKIQKSHRLLDVIPTPLYNGLGLGLNNNNKLLSKLTYMAVFLI